MSVALESGDSFNPFRSSVVGSLACDHHVSDALGSR